MGTWQSRPHDAPQSTGAHLYASKPARSSIASARTTPRSTSGTPWPATRTSRRCTSPRCTRAGPWADGRGPCAGTVRPTLATEVGGAQCATFHTCSPACSSGGTFASALAVLVVAAGLTLSVEPARAQNGFRVTYDVDRTRPDRARVTGRVVNERSEDVFEVNMTAEALDAKGKVLAEGHRLCRRADRPRRRAGVLDECPDGRRDHGFSRGRQQLPRRHAPAGPLAPWPPRGGPRASGLIRPGPIWSN